jgi:hypothetical protein
MAKGTHQYQDDPRNQTILININDELFPRADAKISVFDSGFILGCIKVTLPLLNNTCVAYTMALKPSTWILVLVKKP